MPKYNLKIVEAFFQQSGLPQATPEYQFHPTRRWRFDFAFLAAKIALEIEGGIWLANKGSGAGSHARPIHFLKDMEKYNEAACLGWRIIRVQPKELLRDSTISLVKRALGGPDTLLPDSGAPSASR